MKPTIEQLVNEHNNRSRQKQKVIEQLLNETEQKQKEISNLLRKIDDRDKELEKAYETIRKISIGTELRL